MDSFKYKYLKYKLKYDSIKHNNKYKFKGGMKTLENNYVTQKYIEDNKDNLVKLKNKQKNSTLKNDKQFMLYAVSVDSRNLQYASNELKDDILIVMQAIINSTPDLVESISNEASQRIKALQDGNGINYFDLYLKFIILFIAFNKKLIIAINKKLRSNFTIYPINPDGFLPFSQIMTELFTEIDKLDHQEIIDLIPEIINLIPKIIDLKHTDIMNMITDREQFKIKGDIIQGRLFYINKYSLLTKEQEKKKEEIERNSSSQTREKQLEIKQIEIQLEREIKIIKKKAELQKKLLKIKTEIEQIQKEAELLKKLLETKTEIEQMLKEAESQEAQSKTEIEMRKNAELQEKLLETKTKIEQIRKEAKLREAESKTQITNKQQEVVAEEAQLEREIEIRLAKVLAREEPLDTEWLKNKVSKLIFPNNDDATNVELSFIL